MDVHEILAKLERLGKPETVAIYKRHGSGDKVFGVLTAELAKLAKKIDVDHSLALRLWETGHAEARILALLVADPVQLTRAAADRMVQDDQAHFLACYLGELVARSPIAEKTMGAWMKSPDETRREVGYGILGFLLKAAPENVADEDAEAVLATVEHEIHRSPNWARYAMNGALISIGVHKPALRQKAIAVAKRVGKVDVDHGDTTCKTPDASTSIVRASKRKRCP